MVNVKTLFALAFIALLPFNFKIQPIILVALIGVSFFGLKRQTLLEKYKMYLPYFIGFLLLFIWQVISLLWTVDVSLGLAKLERRAFYVVAFILFILVDRISLSLAIRTYTISNVLLCLAGFVYLIFFFVTEKDYFLEKTFQEGITKETFSYLIFHGRNNLIFLDIHRTYFSLSLLICVVAIFFSKQNYFSSYLKYTILGLFSFVIFLLQAKITVLILMVLLTVIFFKELRRQPKRWMPVSLVLFSTLLILGVYVASPRFMRMAREVSNLSTRSQGSLVERMEYTESAFSLIREAPLLGHGFGDVRNSMKQKLNELGNSKTTERTSYDPHNEFLKVFVGTGLIGFLLLTTAFGLPLYYCYKSKNRVLAIFILMVLIISLVEPLLSRQMGIFTSLFFWGLFVACKQDKYNEG